MYSNKQSASCIILWGKIVSLVKSSFLQSTDSHRTRFFLVKSSRGCLSLLQYGQGTTGLFFLPMFKCFHVSTTWVEVVTQPESHGVVYVEVVTLPESHGVVYR